MELTSPCQGWLSSLMKQMCQFGEVDGLQPRERRQLPIRSGVSPLSFVVLGQTPFSSNARTFSTKPALAAKVSGVSPSHVLYSHIVLYDARSKKVRKHKTNLKCNAVNAHM